MGVKGILAVTEFKSEFQKVIDLSQRYKLITISILNKYAFNHLHKQKILKLRSSLLCFRFPDIVAPCLGIHPIQGDPKVKQRPANMEVT